MSLGGRDGAERIFGDLVSTNYFAVLGTRPYVGRLLTTDDPEQAGAAPLVVLSHQFWLRRFNGDAGILGQTLALNGHPFTVIGVAPPPFHGTTVLTTDVWVPLTMVGELSSRRAVWRGDADGAPAGAHGDNDRQRVGPMMAAAASRLIGAWLFGVGAADPLTFAGSAVLFCIVSVAACYAPARRATTIDASLAIRSK